jgi:hypothetical protein
MGWVAECASRQNSKDGQEGVLADEIKKKGCRYVHSINKGYVSLDGNYIVDNFIKQFQITNSISYVKNTASVALASAHTM